MSEKEALARAKKQLRDVWKDLKKAGVPESHYPQKPGNLKRGEWEIASVQSITANPHAPLWVVNYHTRNPCTGEIHTYTVRHSHGACAVVRINWLESKRVPSILATRQFRQCTNGWEIEFPQAFTHSPGPGERQFSELAERKLDWLLEYADHWEKQHLSQYKDDPGARSSVSNFYFVDIWITEEQFEHALQELNKGEKQTRKTPLQFLCLDVQEVDDRIDDGQLDSLILLGAWMKAQRSKEIQWT